jgi:SAM-dependent methyltransferase
MYKFTCNICGRVNSAAELPWETPTCKRCGSNMRFRALLYLLSRELFGEGACLAHFAKLRAIRGMGLSDDLIYAPMLEEKFDYTNTFLHKEPRLDITGQHPEQWGRFDFILSSDVFEHVTAPVERAFEEAFRLLKPDGFLCVTVPSVPGDPTREHYDGVRDYTVASIGGELVLVTSDAEGRLQVHERPVFHGGPGKTLEMRVFAQNDLARKLKAAGFSSVEFHTENVDEFGIRYPDQCSRPLVARKGKFALPETAVRALVEDHFATMKAVTSSRWLRLGRSLGLGPRFRRYPRLVRLARRYFS